jgi:hypothetical protein
MNNFETFLDRLTMSVIGGGIGISCGLAARAASPAFYLRENKTPDEDRYFRFAYKSARDALKEASVWVMLGYSVPDYDTDMMKVFKKAIRASADTGSRRIFIVSPDVKLVAERLARSVDCSVSCVTPVADGEPAQI